MKLQRIYRNLVCCGRDLISGNLRKLSFHWAGVAREFKPLR